VATVVASADAAYIGSCKIVPFVEQVELDVVVAVF